jgi:hypothetical protein
LEREGGIKGEGLHRKRLEREGLKGFFLAKQRTFRFHSVTCSLFSICKTGTSSPILASGRARVGPDQTTAKNVVFFPLIIPCSCTVNLLFPLLLEEMLQNGD